MSDPVKITKTHRIPVHLEQVELELDEQMQAIALHVGYSYGLYQGPDPAVPGSSGGMKHIAMQATIPVSDCRKLGLLVEEQTTFFKHNPNRVTLKIVPDPDDEAKPCSICSGVTLEADGVCIPCKRWNENRTVSLS